MSSNGISREWLKIAAGYIEARGFMTDGNSTSDEVQAAAFIFDNGIFFLNDEGRTEIRQALLDKYEAGQC
jgi:hypothetical protein